MDYIPLATMLATGQLAEADQVSAQTDESREVFRGIPGMRLTPSHSYVNNVLGIH